MNESKILFNEKCSVCNFEIKHYKKRSDLNFVNCSEMGDKYLKNSMLDLKMEQKYLELMPLSMFGRELKVMRGLQR